MDDFSDEIEFDEDWDTVTLVSLAPWNGLGS